MRNEKYIDAYRYIVCFQLGVTIIAIVRMIWSLLADLSYSVSIWNIVQLLWDVIMLIVCGIMTKNILKGYNKRTPQCFRSIIVFNAINIASGVLYFAAEAVSSVSTTVLQTSDTYSFNVFKVMFWIAVILFYIFNVVYFEDNRDLFMQDCLYKIPGIETEEVVSSEVKIEKTKKQATLTIEVDCKSDNKKENRATKYCRYCGKEIVEDSVFCEYCGKNIG